jgi:MBG domain (YGX type)
VTANAQTRVYGAANPTLTYAATGLVNGDTLSGALATTATATSSVLGSAYAITQGTLANPNYAITYVGANLTVTAAALTVTASNQTKTYGNTFTFAGTEFTSTGLQNGETIGSVTLTSAGSVATANVAGSPYAIVASAAAGGTFTASNYAIGYVNGAMTVTQAALTVTANPQSRAYGDANPTLTYVATGLVNGDTLTGVLATTAGATSNVGLYAITQGTLAASSNYTLTYIGDDLTVTPAPVVDVAQAVLFPSSFSAIVIPGSDNNASANLLSDSVSSACSPESVWKRLRRFGRVELTGRNAGSCQ